MLLLLPIPLLGAAEEDGMGPELAGSTLLEEPDPCAEEDGSPTLDDGAPEEGAMPDDGALLEPKGAEEEGSIPEDATTTPEDEEPPWLDAGLADDAGSMTLLDEPSTDVEAAPELEDEDVPMA
jgi:hypothetical protein